MYLKIATNYKSSFIKQYCLDKNYSYHYDKNIKNAYQYHVMFVKNHKETNNKIVLPDNITTDDLDNLIKNKFPNLFNNIEYHSEIPRTIHFMWLSKHGDNQIPLKYEKNINSYKKYCHDYDIQYWYLNTVNDVIKKELPEFYDTYCQITPWISKCDFARFCIIYLYGGIYTDCDFYCIKSLNALLYDKHEIYVFEKKDSLFNGFFASTPKSEFIYGWLLKMKDHLSYTYVLEKTGPVGFARYYYQIKNKPAITDSKYIIPISYDNCLSDIDDVYVYTSWREGCGWETDGNTDITIGVFIILIIILYILYKIIYVYLI